MSSSRRILFGPSYHIPHRTHPSKQPIHPCTMCRSLLVLSLGVAFGLASLGLADARPSQHHSVEERKGSAISSSFSAWTASPLFQLGSGAVGSTAFQTAAAPTTLTLLSLPVPGEGPKLGPKPLVKAERPKPVVSRRLTTPQAKVKRLKLEHVQKVSMPIVMVSMLVCMMPHTDPEHRRPRFPLSSSTKLVARKRDFVQLQSPPH